MENCQYSGRLPIRKLLKPPISAGQEFVEHLNHEFDMFQLVNTSSLDQTISFALLEHIIRPTMLPKERSQLMPKLPQAIQELIIELLENQRLTLNPFDCLKLGLDPTSLDGLSELPHVIRVYTIDDIYLCLNQIIKEYESPVPISYILSGTNYQAVLYTPTMTFIDGFDSTTGDYKSSMVPALLLKKARKAMFSTSQRKPKTKMTQVIFEVEPCPVVFDIAAQVESERENLERAIEEAQINTISSQTALHSTRQGCCTNSCHLF